MFESKYTTTTLMTSHDGASVLKMTDIQDETIIYKSARLRYSHHVSLFTQLCHRLVCISHQALPSCISHPLPICISHPLPICISHQGLPSIFTFPGEHLLQGLNCRHLTTCRGAGRKVCSSVSFCSTNISPGQVQRLDRQLPRSWQEFESRARAAQQL